MFIFLLSLLLSWTECSNVVLSNLSRCLRERQTIFKCLIKNHNRKAANFAATALQDGYFPFDQHDICSFFFF